MIVNKSGDLKGLMRFSSAADSGGTVQWETAVDRGKRRCAEEVIASDPAKTNVTVLILQQVSLFSNWWAAAEEKCSIGLAGRCVFSFAAAGPPGPPKMANFGVDVVLPIVKTLFRTVLKTLGPHAPLQTGSPLLNWCSSESAQWAVYSYTCLCFELTKTLPVKETFASCLNKNGYWLSLIAFWNAVLVQMWPVIIGNTDSVSLCPEISDAAVKTSMDFFTYRFLFGASILATDLRKRMWQKRNEARVTPTDCRWNVPAALLLKASCGTVITPARAARAGPMFQKLTEETSGEAQEAGVVYMTALQYLADRGFGTIEPSANSEWPVFRKLHYHCLPKSCLEQLAMLRIHPVSFGLQAPRQNDVGSADGAQACGGGVECKEKNRDNCCPENGKVDAAEVETKSAKHDVSADVETRQQHAQEGLEPSLPESNGATHAAPRLAAQGHVLEMSAALPKAELSASQELPKNDVQRPDAQEQRVYRTVFQDKPKNQIADFVSLRDEVAQVLGAQGDTGVYTFSDKGLQGTTRRLLAACKPDACKDCDVRVWAFCAISAKGAELTIRMSGRHGELQAPAGGRLWTAAEHYIINQIPAKDLTTAAVRLALKDAKLRLRCQPDQLHDYISRERKKHPNCQSKTEITVGQLTSHMDKFDVKVTQWRDSPLHQLLVLPGAVVNDQRVCVAFTCPGMIRRACSAENKVIKLAVDGKQKILSNNYTIVTLSFLVPSRTVNLTRDTSQRDARVKANTCTQEPFIQALVNSESEENMTQTFETACAIGAAECGLDLRSQVLQVHKDFAKGIEASRMKAFPFSRPCDDYPHMRRAAHSSLQKFFGVGTERWGPQ